MGEEGGSAAALAEEDLAEESLAVELERYKAANALLEETIAAEQRSKEVALELADEERDVALKETRHDLLLANERIKVLEIHLAEMEVVKSENKRFGATILSLQDQISDLLRQHAEETDNVKKQTFNTRVELEKSFRKSLQMMELELKQKAFKEMDEETKNAVREMARTQDELSLQTNGIEALTKRYLAEREKVKVLRTDKSLLQEHQTVQAKKINGLRQELKKLEADNQEQREQMQQLERACQDRKELLESNLQLESKVRSLEAELQDSKSQCEKYRQRLSKANEHLKAQESKQNSKKSRNYFNSNSELLKSLAEMGKNGAGRPHTKTSLVQPFQDRNLKPMKDSCSMPALNLKDSDYNGILDTWNAKYQDSVTSPPASGFIAGHERID